jgi:hypothetical protein
MTRKVCTSIQCIHYIHRWRGHQSKEVQPVRQLHVFPGVPTHATVPFSWSLQMLTLQTHQE